MELQIEYLPITDLVEYQNNAKIHTPEQIDQIKESIEKFGMCDPIAIWKDNTIIAGHGRLMALRDLGYDKAPVIRLEHLSDEERRAYGLIHNKLTMNTGFAVDLLADELENIIDIDMDSFGFNVDLGEISEPEEEDDSRYTTSIDIPHYTPSGNDVSLDECYDTTKYRELIEEIERSHLPEDEREFLKLAATRHIVFSYKRIADYYAKATPAMQRLMENSALVIIDVNDAIKNSFAQVQSYLDAVMSEYLEGE